ncbi:MAG: ABC transporter substrate-binding protein [Phycisphaerae bacterium]|nr:ABC transporter substrate-binding protein [Phycisphaerae bacterium]
MKRIIALVVAGFLAACDSGSNPRQPSSLVRVRLQLNWVPEPEFGGIYAAERAGFFKDEGLDVEIIKGGPGVAAPQLAASGQVEFAVVSGDQVLTLREAGGELVAVYASFQSDPMGVMVHEASEFRSMEELWKSDATVACETNLPFVAMLNEKFGGKNLKFVPHQGSVAQFAANPKLAQQCFVFAEPVSLELKGIKTRVFPTSASGYDPYNVVIATNAQYAREYPETVRKLARALARGWQSYLDEPGPTNERMAAANPAMKKDAMDLAASKQASLITSADTAALGLGAMTSARWTTLASQLKDLGKIKSIPTATDVFVWSSALPQ